MRVEGFGFQIRGVGLRVSGLGFRVKDSGLRVEGLMSRPLRVCVCERECVSECVCAREGV